MILLVPLYHVIMRSDSLRHSCTHMYLIENPTKKVRFAWHPSMHVTTQEVVKRDSWWESHTLWWRTYNLQAKTAANTNLKHWIMFMKYLTCIFAHNHLMYTIVLALFHHLFYSFLAWNVWLTSMKECYYFVCGTSLHTNSWVFRNNALPSLGSFHSPVCSDIYLKQQLTLTSVQMCVCIHMFATWVPFCRVYIYMYLGGNYGLSWVKLLNLYYINMQVG